MEKLTVDAEIVLKELSLSSAGLIFQSINASKKYLSEWLPFAERTKSVEDTISFINSVNYSSKEKKDKVFEIWYSGQFAGLFGLKDIDKIYHKLEIGYWLDEQMQRKGIIRKSLKILIDYIFYEMKMNRIVIKVAVGNAKSSTVPKIFKFSFEGIERESETLHGKYVDMEIYSLLKKEWSRG